MANLTVSTDIDSFMQSANKAAARTSLGTPASSTTISAGTGLTGGGDLSANRTLSVDFSVVASTASIAAITPASIGAVATSDVISLGKGGTGATSAPAALTALGAQPALTTAAPLAFSLGGTGAITQQAALNAIAGAVTVNQVLKGNGTNVTLAALTSADIPTLNQNTTGTAANVTGVVAIANGGTNATAQQAALNNISGTQTTGYHFRSDGTNVTLQPMSVADVTAGTLGVVYGGTGGTNGDDAINNLGFPAQIRPVVSNVNLGTGTTASYVYTATTAVPSFVAHSILTAGDNILCSGATNTMNLGPWVVTATGYQAVFVGTLAASSTVLTINSVTSGTVAVGQTIVIPNSTNTITIASFGTFTVLAGTGTVNLSASITQTQSNVTMASGTGIAPVYTRPAWFRGTLLASAYYFQTTKSSSAANGQGNVYSIYPTSPSESLPSVTANASGGTSWSNVLIAQRAANATTGSNSFSGRQTLWAGSAGGNIPLSFSAGAIATTPVAHCVEWDGTSMYLTTSAGARTTNVANTVVPATATSAGAIGQIAVDNAGSWLYVCTATNVWKRVLLTTF